ncbi:hypothetical protein BpHYR1_012918 [Brachionus plicatilis]|uniref:Uncharacterized protein n=1 Tax=Brachionus plicatilis TaxID=10195 RepID=A0A3M7P8A9_BRAPC|nr:hypothetical protein BpHYR1_012918 [Brachionus plicatilis]
MRVLLQKKNVTETSTLKSTEADELGNLRVSIYYRYRLKKSLSISSTNFDELIITRRFNLRVRLSKAKYYSLIKIIILKPNEVGSKIPIKKKLVLNYLLPRIHSAEFRLLAK